MPSWLEDNPIVLEVVPPPRRLGAEGLERRLRRLERLLEEFPFGAVNLPEIREEPSRSDEGGRRTPFEPRIPAREIAREIIRRFGVRPIVNHVVAARPPDDLEPWLRESLEIYGVQDFVLVGPASSTEPVIGPSVPEANEIARATLPAHARIGNICIPGRVSRELAEPERMEEKVRAGAHFFTTQIQYHATPCRDLLELLVRRAPGAAASPLIVSLCPLRCEKSLAFLRWLGVELDEPTATRLTEDPEHVLERSIEHLAGVWERIQAHVRARDISVPLGLNIAPVGPMPIRATIALARAVAPHITPGS